jgi:hypothetical protein
LRAYLLDRFRTDGDTLRQRVSALRDSASRHGAPPPGPDATMSQRMASACDDVVAMIVAIPADDDLEVVADALRALIPLLDQRAAQAAAAPPVKAVYVGAATRIREVVEAELRHARGDGATVDIDDEDVDDDEDASA